MKYNNQLVSIVITTFGRAKFLKNAINSVLNQTYQNLEIIVVDDNIEGSAEREETQKLIKENFSQIKYIKNKENRGACFSRNEGIKNSEGDYIAFLDDDDEFFETKIEKQLYKMKKLLVREPNIGVISCRMGVYNELNEKINLSKYNLIKEINDLKDFLEGRYISGTSSLFFRRDILLKVGGFQEIESCQEAYLILKILEKGYLYSCIKEELVLYRKHNFGNIGTGDKAKKGQVKYLKEIELSINNNLKNSKKALLNYNYQLLDMYSDFKYLLNLIKLNPFAFITLKGILKYTKRSIK